MPLTLAAFAAQAAGLDRSFTVPRPLGPDEVVWLELAVGPIARGEQIEVRTATGQMLGTVSPFGLRPGQDAGVYTLPVPASAVHDGVLSVRVTIGSAATPPRPPTPAELKSLKLRVP